MKTNGKEITADQVVWTTGIHSVNAFLDRSHLTEGGWIATDSTLRVQNGQGRLFAFGDCGSTLPKSAHHLGHVAAKVGKNLAKMVGVLEDGTVMSAQQLEAVALQDIKVGLTVGITSLGPKDGVFYCDCFHTQFLLPKMKKISLFEGSWKMAEYGF